MLVPKGSRRLDQLDEDDHQPVYAGGMTIREYSNICASTVGVELSRETSARSPTRSLMRCRSPGSSASVRYRR